MHKVIFVHVSHCSGYIVEYFPGNGLREVLALDYDVE